MINIQRRLVLAIASIVVGVGFSGTAVRAAGMLETQATRTWLLEGNKANQSSVWGSAPDGWFGGNLAVGDVNGDGYDDLITSARYATTTVQGGGEVYVFPGPMAFHNLYNIPNRAALVIQGPSAYSPQLGTYLDSGDMNGDGIDDIVMGSWTSGKAYVYLGSSSIQSSSPMTVVASPENMALTVSPAGDGLALCDFNGDGYQDLFVEQTVDHGSYVGMQVWGVLGSSALTMTHPITRVLPAEADIVIKEFQPTAGLKNIACGDVDGDGIPDLVIGIYGDSPAGRHDAGAVYVLRGNPAITSGHPVTLTMPDQADAIIEGVDGGSGGSGSFGDRLGEVVATADVNQDGRADLILGATGAAGPDNLLPNAGEVYLWLGRALSGQRFVVSSQASWIVHGEKPGDVLGTAIATGDFNHDGYPEILLGCVGCDEQGPPTYLDGQGYVLEPLQITGQVTVSAVSQLNIVPDSFARCLGIAAAAMDFNADGFSDLILSAPCSNDPPGHLAGTVYVVSYPDHYRSYLPWVQK